MARLFDIAREEEQSTNAEGQVVTDGPEANEKDLKDPVQPCEGCSDKEKEEIIEIKEAVEEAVEVQEEIEEQIEKNDEALATDPENVTEEVVVEAQECLVASLSKLGLNKTSLAKFRVSFESGMNNAQRLSAVNKQLRAANKLIRSTNKKAIADMFSTISKALKLK